MQNTLNNVKVESSYKFIHIIDICTVFEPNEHGTAIIKGIIDKSSEVDVLATKKSRIRIKHLENNNETLVFSGLVGEISLSSVNNIFYLTIHAFTDTILLDMKKRFRSFQNINDNYTNIFEKVLKTPYDGDYLDVSKKDKKQERIIIQYDETDWEFLKRLASELGTVILAETKLDKPKVYLGIPTLKSFSEPELNSTKSNDVLDREIFINNTSQKSEIDFMNFKIFSNISYEIGTDLNYSDKKLVISKREFHVYHHGFENHYILKTREGICQNFIPNLNIVGASIQATVLNVKEGFVKLHLDIDEKQSESDAEWLPLKTFYSNHNNTGFHFMLEPGSCVTLCFPTYDENDAFISTVVRLDGDKNKKTSNPDIKFIENTFGKELTMAPKELKFTATNGNMYIKLEESSGIEISSDKDIVLSSTDNIEITAKDVSIKAKDGVYVTGGSAGMMLSDITHFKGNRVVASGLLKK